MAILPLQLARVSNTLRTNVATQSLVRTQQDLIDAENQLATGRRLNSPSDDPGSAAIAQQLRKTLEARHAYSANLQQAGSQLSEVDSSLGNLSDLLDQAQSIASANVGSDVTPDARKAASAIIESIYSRALSVANKQLNGVYLFAGERGNAQPFVEEDGGVKFVGSNKTLQNQFDESTKLSFQIDGGKVFGAPSARVKGSVDLSPSMTTATRLSDLRGATGDGVRLGSIEVSDGATTRIVDLSTADTMGDVINLINSAAVGTVTAAIAGDGVSLQLSAGGGNNVSVDEVSGGTTAADLGILDANGAGVGTPLSGTSVAPIITPLTTLASLRGGAGIDLTGMILTNGETSATLNFSGATTVEDLLNQINGSKTGVRAQINAAGNGIDLLNPTQGRALTIAESGGTTAADLGIRSFSADTPLAELNNGKGVKTVDGDDIQITDSNGVAFPVDLSNLTTIQDVIDAINTAATGASAGVTASFAATGNGIVLTDTAAGSGTIALSALNFSTAAADLGIDQAAIGSTITGNDVNAVTADGIFSNLSRLRDALQNNDQQAITAAAEGIKSDYDRIAQMRGETGARVQDFEARQNQIEDQNIATKSLLSSMEDTDFTSAIARFQTLQTTLQASLATAQRVMNLSLLDFLS